MLEFGKTPVLPSTELQDIGFSVAAYPLTLLSASTLAMKKALQQLNDGESTEDENLMLNFPDLQDAVGFNDYYKELDRYL